MADRFPRIHLLQTAIASDNVGDEIIVEACLRELAPVLKTAYVTTSASHDGMGPSGRALAAAADVVLMLGTNALRARKAAPWRYYMWKFSRRDIEAVAGKVVLMGVGANKGFAGLQGAQRSYLKRILSPGHVHSVRDASAKQIVEACGLEAIPTSCPTLWRWRDAGPDCPAGRAAGAVFTLTRHKPKPDLDRAMIAILRQRYSRLWFWPQQPRDLDYLEELGEEGGVSVIPPNLAAYDAVLAGEDVDVIGTRLHGTIRALSHKRRPIVIAIDSRAREIGAETGLTILPRTEIPTRLEGMIEAGTETRLDLDKAAIARFLGQFPSG